MVTPVGSSSVPTKSDYEVARVVPVGSESSSALVVLEVGNVAIVVLDIANGLTALQLVVELLFYRLRKSNRRSSGRAEKSEKSGSELHCCDDDDRRRSGWYGVCCGFKRSRSIGSAPVLYLTSRSDAHGSTRCYSA